MLYKEPKTTVMTNGTISPFFNLTWGTRQRCSLSPLLFIIFLEILAVSVRAHPEIRGVRGGDNEHELLLYADGILAVVSKPLTSVPHLMDTIQSFFQNFQATPSTGANASQCLSPSHVFHL